MQITSIVLKVVVGIRQSYRMQDTGGRIQDAWIGRFQPHGYPALGVRIGILFYDEENFLFLTCW